MSEVMNFRRRICSFIGLALSAMLVGGCVENDLPYPSVTVNIAAIKGEGFTVKELDVVNRSLVLTLDERTDIRNVRIDSIAYAIVPHNVSVNLDLDGALGDITSSVAFPGTFDLRESLRAKLSLFEDFEWTITAEQTIDRRFRVAGQVGKPVFDVKTILLLPASPRMPIVRASPSRSCGWSPTKTPTVRRRSIIRRWKS